LVYCYNSFCRVCYEDYPAVRELIKQKPYCGVMIGLQQVRETSSIQVDGVDKLTSDHLMLYFESIGVDVADVKPCPQQDYAIVDLTDNTGKKAVCVLMLHTHTHT